MVGSVSVTPHISAYTETTISESSRICFENIVSYIEGNPQNLAFQE
jgi:phosphoglycerate dehydrogenase-like enzyme